jgi:protein-tyrosine-phosphatase
VSCLSASTTQADRNHRRDPEDPEWRRGAVQRRCDQRGLQRHLPLFPGVSYRDWKLPDPAGQDLPIVRAIRDEIAERVQALIAELLCLPPSRKPTERNIRVTCAIGPQCR